MKKSPKETLFWHSVQNKYPESGRQVLLNTNDGVMAGYWDEENRAWRGVGGYKLNSDTHVTYWSRWPKGVPLYEQ